eukprot:193165-Amphidinium_carterae.1
MDTQSGSDQQLDLLDPTSADLAMSAPTTDYSPEGAFGEEPASMATATAVPGESASTQQPSQFLESTLNVHQTMGQENRHRRRNLTFLKRSQENRLPRAEEAQNLRRTLCTQEQPSLRHLRSPSLGAKQVNNCVSAEWQRDAGSLHSVVLSGGCPSHKLSGNDVSTSSSILLQTGDKKAKVPHRCVMLVAEWGVEPCPWLSVCAATTGLVTGTCLCRHAWTAFIQCVPATRAWNRLLDRVIYFGSSSRHWPYIDVGLSLRQYVCLGYRQQGWIPPNLRIGEAKKPGPSICSANPGGWSRIDRVLNLQHDIVAVQETFVLREQMSGAKYTADKLGHYSSFTPARKTDGRPSGGLALLCRQAQPLQRMEKGTHWELGRWAHHLLPFEGGLHVFNVYGYSSDKDRAQELGKSALRSLRRSPLLATGRFSSLGPGTSSLTTSPLICSMEVRSIVP